MSGLYFYESGEYSDLSGDYSDLFGSYIELYNNFAELDNKYFILTGEHIELENDYNDLLNVYDTLLNTYDILLKINGNLLYDYDSLLNNYNLLQIEYNNFLNDYDILLMVYENLSNNYDTLSSIYNITLTIYILLQTEYNNLLNNYNTLLNDYNNLLSNYDILSNDYGVLQNAFNILQADFDLLQLEYDILSSDYNILLNNYSMLLGSYGILQNEYNTLLNTFNALSIAYDYIIDTIKQLILPIQYSIFAEAVRRYYIHTYLEGTDFKLYWKNFTGYCRDVILHDSGQYNAFTEVSDAFSDALTFGSNTMGLAWDIMYWTLYPWLPNWDGWGLTGNELTDIETIVNWCINEIDYEYDSHITYGQEYFDWDYIKFSVETAFRTMGDCEDQAILTAAYLESCGFETAIVINHDSIHPTIGEFYHGNLWVYIEDPTTFWLLYPGTSLWTIDGGATLWSWLDTTGDVPFGSTPSWLQDYVNYNITLTSDIMTIAFNDIGGTIETNAIENSGIISVMPT